MVTATPILLVALIPLTIIIMHKYPPTINIKYHKTITLDQPDQPNPTSQVMDQAKLDEVLKQGDAKDTLTVPEAIAQAIDIATGGDYD